jgi:hypothetical protein
VDALRLIAPAPGPWSWFAEVQAARRRDEQATAEFARLERRYREQRARARALPPCPACGFGGYDGRCAACFHCAGVPLPPPRRPSPAVEARDSTASPPTITAAAAEARRRAEADFIERMARAALPIEHSQHFGRVLGVR